MINFYKSYIVAFLERFSCWNLIILSMDLLSIFKIHRECACYTPVHKCDSRHYSYLFERSSLQKHNSPDHLIHDSNFIVVNPHFNTFYGHFHFSHTKVNTVMLMLTKPFAEEFSTFRSADRESGKGEGQNEIIKRYTQTAPPGADGLICTCSS